MMQPRKTEEQMKCDTSEAGFSPDNHHNDPLEISCRYYYYKPMAAFFNAFHLRSYQHARIRLETPVLDVGCSNGTFGVVLAQTLGPIPRMTGIDLDPAGIRRARNVASHCYQDLLVGDATRLPFDSGSFKTVISNASMVSFGSGVDKAIGEMHRVLEHGGRVYATLATDLFEKNYLFPSLYRRIGLERLATAATAMMNRRLPHFYAYSASEWSALFEDKGFRVDRMSGFLPVSHLGMWGFLAWTPMRLHGILRHLDSPRIAEQLGRFYKQMFSKRYADTPVDLNPHESAYIFLEASKH